MQKIKNISLILIALFLLVFLLFAFLGPFSVISEVQLNTHPDLKNMTAYKQKEKDILSYLNKYKDKSIWQVDLKLLVKKINSFYSGMEVSAVRKFPNRLIVSLQKKAIAFLLLKDKGMFYSVSYEGNIENQISLEESLDYPILRGKDFLESKALRRQLLSVISVLPQTGDGFSVQNISEISYNPSNESLIFYLIEGRFILELNLPLSPKKIQNINFVLNYLRQEERLGAWLDARFDKKIIVKKRK